MSKKFLYWLSLVLYTCTSLPYSFAEYSAIEAYEDKTVAQINVIMENLPAESSFDPKTVQSRLKIKTGDPFSQLTFDSDLKTLAEEYDRVEPRIDVRGNQVYITLRVWPKPIIHSINWNGNTIFKDKTLQKE